MSRDWDVRFIHEVDVPLVLVDPDLRLAVDANAAALRYFCVDATGDIGVMPPEVEPGHIGVHQLDGPGKKTLITVLECGPLWLVQANAVSAALTNSKSPGISENQLYLETFRSSPTPTMIVNRREGRPVNLNPAFVTFLGFGAGDVAEVMGQNAWLHQSERDEYLGIVRSLGRVDAFPATLVDKQNNPIPVHIHSRLIDEREPDYAITLLEDQRGRLLSEATLSAEQQRLRASEARFDAVFRNSPTPTALVELGVVVDVNQAMVELTGYSTEQIGEINFDTIWVEAAEREAFLALAASGPSVSAFEATIRRRDGVPRDVLIYRDLIEPDESGLAVVQMVDITAQKEMQGRFEALFFSSPTPAVLIKASGDVESANLAAERFLGADLATMQGSRRQRWVDPSVRARFLRELEERGAVSGFEAEIWNASGAVLRASVFARVINVPGENMLLLQFVDLRGKEMLHVELQAALAQLEQAQALARMGSFVWDEFGGIRYSNQLRKMFGLAGFEEQELAMAMALVVEADKPRVESAFESLIQGKQERIEIEYAICPAGTSELMYCLTIASLVVSADARLLVGVTQDITEQKKAEAEKRAFEAGVQQTQKLESLGVLAGGIAHDFNNLLTSIIGNTELGLQTEGLPDPARHNLETVLAASRRAADLTYQLLVYSGRGKFDMRPVDLNELVREISGLLQLSIGASGQLNLDCSADLSGIRADSSQIQQIVMNLIINAAEALEDADGIIDVSTERVFLSTADLALYDLSSAAAGHYVMLRVKDNGVGMTDAVRERIFEPFYTSKFAGRGLGMAAVMGIVRGHNGGISIATEAGKGTEISVIFPALDFKPPVQLPVDREPSAARGARKRVLVVDDDELIREYTRLLLTTHDYVVEVVGTGALGLEMCAVGDISVVLLDVTMPGLSGHEVIAKLEDALVRPPVILMSGYGESQAEGLVYSGGLDFISKPFTANTLLQKVAMALLSAA